MRSRDRIWLSLGLACLLLVPATAMAQSTGENGRVQEAKPGKRPPLRARVVTEPGGAGVAVVAADAAANTNSGTSVDSGQPNVSITVQSLPGEAGAPAQPEVENWLVDGPVPAESWLRGGEVQPAAYQQPVTPQSMAPQPTPQQQSTGSQQAPGSSAPLLGVQHYMESTQADQTAASTTTRVPARPTNAAVPPRPAGGTSRPDRQPAVSSVAAAQSSSAPTGTYRLGAGDQIDVHVWRNPDLSRSLPVRPDGLISLPLVGELRAAGRTVAELNAEITTILEQFVQRPTVTVSVTQVRSMVVYVNGRVASPGTLVLERPINVMQAIAMAGGLQEFANRNGVVVIRTVNGQRTRIPFRYGDAVTGKGEVAEFVLQSGDVVYVP